ncbi:hypothetical protein [Ruficoccus sp. ZRK36]|uniref:hypothetical protein n=1 Tax=Ruficoccus sp. ZRK36 TaxID=2866311 RepID=UPI001C72D9B9|nr:hypothetical protein [Ruficoccus sp. ZRK36]QYY35793.1 hypothetical protein K0V07_16025 [Ruficoccus sp. ZRK36]
MLPRPLLLAFVLLTGCLAAARADTFQVYVFYATPAWLEAKGYTAGDQKPIEFVGADGKPQKLYPAPEADLELAEVMISCVGEDGLTLMAYGELAQTEPLVWELNQTYTLRYAKMPETDGQPAGTEERAVGLSASIRVDENDPRGCELKISYVTLESWVPQEPGSSVLLPVLATRESRTRVRVPDPLFCAGGLSRAGEEVLYLVVQRVTSGD